MTKAASTYHVLIVEDDFRVANINEAFVDMLEAFEVTQIVKTGAETREFLKKATELPDVILLDIYIPDVDGLELLWEIRKNYPDIHVVMITAANETGTIQEALTAGIFDYIIKPLKQERIHETFMRLKQEQELLNKQDDLTQDELDRLRFGRANVEMRVSQGDLPKGIDAFTLEAIKGTVIDAGEKGLTAADAGDAIGASRSTARRYLEYLISTGEVSVKVHYGDVGRPVRRYVLRQST